jgi:hypothetical protein
MCDWMLSTNIPWFKFQMPEFQSSLEKYCKQHVQDHSTLRKHYLPISYEETLENIRGNIGDAFIWVAMDETTDSVGRFSPNLVARKLDTEVPSNPHLICFKVMHHTNHSTAARFVNDGLKLLWPTGVHEKVLILYSDDAAHIRKDATALKVFYPNLIHFTCIAHGLQRVVKKVRVKFPQVNKSILMTKKMFQKAHIECNPISSTCRRTLVPRTSANKLWNLDRSSQLLQ